MIAGLQTGMKKKRKRSEAEIVKRKEHREQRIAAMSEEELVAHKKHRKKTKKANQKAKKQLAKQLVQQMPKKSSNAGGKGFKGKGKPWGSGGGGGGGGGVWLSNDQLAQLLGA